MLLELEEKNKLLKNILKVLKIFSIKIKLDKKSY